MIKLKGLYIYLTWRCNLYCKHCWVSAGSNQSKDYKNIDYISLLDQAALLGAEFIKISGGEPLLEETIVRDIIQYASKLSLDVLLETNGTLISPEFAAYLNKYSCSVSVSIDGDKKRHNEMRNHPTAFDLMEKGIQNLVSNNVFPDIVHSFFDFDEDNFLFVIDFMKKYNLKNLKLNPVIKLGRADTYALISDNNTFTSPALELLDIKNKYCEKRTDGINVRIMLPLCYEGYSLLFKKKTNAICCPFQQILSILPDGTVGLCGESKDIKELQYGNIFDRNLTDIWENSQKLQYIQSLNKQSQFSGICEKCILFDLCGGGCRIIAIKGSGMINGSNPLCEELYKKKAFPYLRK